jgi:hypothetical protein
MAEQKHLADPCWGAACPAICQFANWPQGITIRMFIGQGSSGDAHAVKEMRASSQKSPGFLAA